MSLKNTFIPVKWHIDQSKNLTFWVNPHNLNKARTLGLKSTGNSREDPVEKIKYVEFSLKIPRDTEIKKEKSGSTYSWKFQVENGTTIILTYGNKAHKNIYYVGTGSGTDFVDQILGCN